LEEALKGIEIPKPSTYDEDYEKTGKPPEMAKCRNRIETHSGGLPKFDGTWDTYIKNYYRSAMSIDYSVGRIMKVLDKKGIADDTILIYTTDNGFSLGDHGLSGKHFTYEGSSRVPMLIRYPRLAEAGTRRQEMALLNDIAPTVLDLCGVEIPSDMTGESWKPLLKTDDSDPSWRDEILLARYAANRSIVPSQVAIRTDRYKLIRYPFLAFHELYDLENDPEEINNLFENPKYTDLRKEMLERLDKLIEETDWRDGAHHSVESCWLLGPADEVDMAQLKQTLLAKSYVPEETPINIGDKQYSWKKMQRNESGVFDMSEDLQGEGSVLVAVSVNLNVERDPLTTLFYRPFRPMKAYSNGELFANIPPGLATRLNPCNPPLVSGNNLVPLPALIRMARIFSSPLPAPPLVSIPHTCIP